MNVRVLTLFIAVATPLVAHDYWCLNNHVHLYVDYGYIRRQGGRDLPLVHRETDVQKTVVDTDDLLKGLHRESAVRAGMIYCDSPCESWEMAYTYFFPWSSKTHACGDADLFFPFKDGTLQQEILGASRAEVSYQCHLQNGELNYWRHLTPQRVDYFSFSWNAGARLMYLSDEVDLSFFSTAGKSPYEIFTWNQLFGVQLGAMLQINPTDCWTWTFMVKGAGFLTGGQIDVDIRDAGTKTTLRQFQKAQWTDSWLLEGYAELACHLGSSMSLRIGYQGYILTGVALALNQRDVARTTRSKLNMEGQIIIDGVYAGIDIGF